MATNYSKTHLGFVPCGYVKTSYDEVATESGALLLCIALVSDLLEKKILQDSTPGSVDVAVVGQLCTTLKTRVCLGDQHRAASAAASSDDTISVGLLVYILCY